MRTLRDAGRDAIGLDLLPSPFTDHTGDLADPAFVDSHMPGIGAVIHTATLHKPHVATHTKQAFIDTNISGTLNVLQAAATHGVAAVVYTSTTSVFGDALVPPPGQPAAWITEDVTPVPKNIYGVTKAAAEDLCQLFHRNHGVACVVLRTSRFFPEPDDNPATRDAYADTNAKVNELLCRRVDLADAVAAHLCAIERAPDIGFNRYIVSATTPFTQSDLAALRTDAPAVTANHVAAYQGVYQDRGWRMFPAVDRVYVNARARQDLGWKPVVDFAHAIARLATGEPPHSRLAGQVGSKGYHGNAFADGRYPVD